MTAYLHDLSDTGCLTLLGALLIAALFAVTLAGRWLGWWDGRHPEPGVYDWAHAGDFAPNLPGPGVQAADLELWELEVADR